MNWRTTAPLIVGAIMAASGGSNVRAHAIATETHSVKRVFLAAGNLGSIERKRIWCGYGYSTCTFAMSIMANVGEATCKGEWAIIGSVDGNSVDGGPLLEALPGAGNTQTHMWQGVYTTSGEAYHNLEFQLYLPCSANANQ